MGRWSRGYTRGFGWHLLQYMRRCGEEKAEPQSKASSRGWLGSALDIGEDLTHSEGVHSSTAASGCWKVKIKVVRASGRHGKTSPYRCWTKAGLRPWCRLRTCCRDHLTCLAFKRFGVLALLLWRRSWMPSWDCCNHEPTSGKLPADQPVVLSLLICHEWRSCSIERLRLNWNRTAQIWNEYITLQTATLFFFSN